MIPAASADEKPRARSLSVLRPAIYGLLCGAVVFGAATWRSVPPELAELARPVTSQVSQMTAAVPLYFPNCDVARAAGFVSIPAGRPGYRAELDGDHNGLACEPVALQR